MKIPTLDNKVKVFEKGNFIGLATADQVCMLIVDAVQNNMTEFLSFEGHKDTNNGMGEIVEATVDKLGNVSDCLFELSFIRRATLSLIRYNRKNNEISTN